MRRLPWPPALRVRFSAAAAAAGTPQVAGLPRRRRLELAAACRDAQLPFHLIVGVRKP